MLHKEIIVNVIGNIEVITILALINIICLLNILYKLNLRNLSIVILSSCPPNKPQKFKNL